MNDVESIESIPKEITSEVPLDETVPPKKKQLSEDRLQKLAKARERASEVAREKRERKTKPLDPDPIVVIEQDESDEDSFEGPPGVLFVRRRRKKPEPPPAPTVSPEMQLLYASMFGSRSY